MWRQYDWNGLANREVLPARDPPVGCRTSLIRLPCFYYFFLAVVVIGYETTATARWALLFLVHAFFGDTITVAVWTGFHVCASWDADERPRHVGGAQYAYAYITLGRQQPTAVGRSLWTTERSAQCGNTEHKWHPSLFKIDHFSK